MSEKNTAVAIKPMEEAGTINALLKSDDFKNQVTRALPKHLTGDRFLRVATTTFKKIPKLANCSQASFLNALLTLSQLGLEPDGRLAHLIPFGSECQLIIDYKGLVDLAMRTGLVSNIHADKICSGDVFEYDRGMITKHKVDFTKPRGKAYAYYALIRFKDGSEKAEVMPKEDVDKIRKRSRAGNSGPWVTDYDEMAKKTAFRRLSKWIQLSPEFREALDHDDDKIDERRFESAKVAVEVTRPRFTEEPAALPESPHEPPQEETGTLTHHEQIAVNLADLGINQSDFVESLRNKLPKGDVPKNAATVHDLSDSVAAAVISDGIDATLSHIGLQP